MRALYCCQHRHPPTASAATLLSCSHHTMASMEPTQISAAAVTALNTMHIIQQYMQNQNLQKQASRRWQRGEETDEDMDIDFSQSTVCNNVDILVAMGQAHAMEH
ncbi:hypothetical protein UY3_16293 [Chelonia mydas]|uniref:Uncharacterized protein n=1 Tax=Chelonia mydas TaxID=8469 RepID=M7BEF9_CHEMY|nr:hypothetical protein UY3_16293 [Chelonia mydas]